MMKVRETDCVKVCCVCRARSGKGTGKAKKGGAGGKYTWEGAGGALLTGDDLEVLYGPRLCTTMSSESPCI